MIMTDTKLPESKLTKRQKKEWRKDITVNGEPVTIIAEVRHDDECGNGHNSFSVTGEIYEKYPQRGEPSVTHESGKKLWLSSCGCIHEDVAKHFPELAPFIRWHLASTDGPMHFIANVIYHAGDRDCHGKRKGEVKSYDKFIQFKDSAGKPWPILWQTSGNWTNDKFIAFCEEQGAKAVADSEILPVDHKNSSGDSYKFGPKYTLGGFDVEWHGCPFESEAEALAFLEAAKYGFEIVSLPDSWGEGKERDFAAARSCAAGLELTDEELSKEPEELKAILLERLPALMDQFKRDVESLGFVY